MTVKSSTGLRNHLMDTGSFKSGMSGGSIRIFAGPAPADADAAETGTLLCVVTNNGTGTGVTFAAAAANGVLPKAPGEVWLGTNVASGTATHYRLVATGDTGTASTTEMRQQGTVGTIGADMNISSVVLTSGAPQSIDYATMTLLP